MKHCLIVLLILLSAQVHGQSSDFVLLKKNGKTVASYFPGSKILFTSNSGSNIQAFVTAVKNDTLFLKEFVIRQIPTQLGIYMLDTTYYYANFHYKDIYSIGEEGRKFDIGSSGGALMGGGLLLTVASGVVYLADNKNFSPQLLVASAGLMGVGYLLSRNAGKGRVIGKKYQLQYIQAGSINRG